MIVSGPRLRSESFEEMERSQLTVKDVAKPIYIYATQSGRVTFDQGDAGGNPFASALVEVLGAKRLGFKRFLHQLTALTEAKSKRRQRPDMRGQTRPNTWQVLPPSPSERRVALVMVFSDYSTSGGVKSLPGAARDLSRIGDALEQAGFETERVLDPNRLKLRKVLQKFTDRSSTSEVAALYTTGHGVEVDEAVYVLPGNYPALRRNIVLNQRAIRLTELGSACRAKHVNLIFYGGCRNNPFE